MLLVTGGTGFVGGHLLEHVRGPARALVRRRSACLPAGIEPVFADLATGEGLAEAIRGADTVIHLAGVTKALRAGDYFAGNARATENLARLAAGRGIRFVHVSSLAAAGPSLNGTPAKEDDTPHPVSEYGRSKLEGECIVRALLPEAVIVRPPVVYGPGDRKLLPLFKLARFGVLPSAGDGTERVSLLHVRDLAVGLVAALEHPAAAGQTFFFADRDAPSLHELLRTVGLAAGADVHVVPLPPVAVFGAALLTETLGRLVRRTPSFNSDLMADLVGHSWVCSPEHAREVLGFEAKIGWREGLRDSAGWYLAQSLVE